MSVVCAQENMPSEGILLIVARSNIWRDSLVALLRTLPEVCVLDPVEECSTMLPAIPEHQPAVLVVDINVLEDQGATLLTQLKSDRPQARCLIFVDSHRRQVEARDAGADAVLLKGFTTPELFSAVNELLARSAPAGAG